MLASTPSQLCLLSSKSRNEGIWTFAGFSGDFLLPSVMDPSSYNLFRVFLYKTNQEYNTRVCWSDQCCWVEWILFSVRFPTFEHNKALWGGFTVCNHHKCFIPSMHRLCCLKERLLYSVLSPVCAISLMNFLFTSSLPFSPDFPLLWEECSTLVLFDMNGRLRDVVKIVCVCACAHKCLFYSNLQKSRVLVGSGARGWFPTSQDYG